MRRGNKDFIMYVPVVMIFLSIVLLLGYLAYGCIEYSGVFAESQTEECVEVRIVDADYYTHIQTDNKTANVIHTYSSTVLYNGKEWYLSGSGEYEYCRNHIGEKIDAVLYTYNYKNGKTKKYIKRLIYPDK